MSKRKVSKPIKRKPPWILGGIVLILLTFLFLLQSSNVWKNLSVDSASETLILYALSSLNFIAFIVFAFILIRSLLKLRQERRALQLGSKIKTRLLIYFAAVSILPLIAMAVFSYLFMNRAVERWFTQIPENVIRKANDIRSKANEEQIAKLKKIAPMLAQNLDGENVTESELQQILEVGDLALLEIRTENNQIVAKAESGLSMANKEILNKELSDFIENTAITESEEKKLIFDISKAEMSDGNQLILALEMPEKAEIEQIAQKSLIELDTMKSQQIFVRQTGITTLGLLTFLLIFAASWTAFYIGKNLTRPIRALALGADEIAKGNFAHRVDTFAEDELELLVKSFNVMSAKLEENSDELESRRKYIETVLQSLSTGVISFEGENRVTTINKAAKEIFKLEDADFRNSKLSQLVKEENKQILEKLIGRAKRIGQATEQTSLHREDRDGIEESADDLPVALTASALPDGNGVVLVIEDLTELITAQRSSAWQEVARRMAHEIKNPLTPIQLSAERIAKNFSKNTSIASDSLSVVNSNEKGTMNNGQLEKVVNESTETILREVSSLKSMVDEFSRYARLPDVRLSEGDVNEIIMQATFLYEDRIDEVTIKTDLAENLPTTLIDAEQLKRVFVNLIDNAFEAFDKDNESKQINLKTFHDAARGLIVTEISDNGKGIHPSGFQKLFQPYFSTKGRGTGLGLAIVQRIISEHDGKIKAVANTPKGAKFIVELPTNV